MSPVPGAVRSSVPAGPPAGPKAARLEEPTAVRPIFEGHAQGFAAQLLTGRSLSDLVAGAREGQILTLKEAIRRSCEARGIVIFEFSIAGGFEWATDRVPREPDRRTIESALKEHGLVGLPRDEMETRHVLRGIHSLARAQPTAKWADGREMRFAFLVEFAEHLLPGGPSSGSPGEDHIHCVEIAALIGSSLALRDTGNLVLFHGRESLIDDVAVGSLHRQHLPQPDLAEKLAFVNQVVRVYPKAQLEDGLSLERVARLSARTPNRGLEEQFRASHYTGQPVTYPRLVERKRREVELLSEHTLTALDVSSVRGVALRGENVLPAKQTVQRVVRGLATGDRNTAGAILLCGAPGCGKTDLVQVEAAQGNVEVYRLNSPKGGIVGETERKVALQWRALNEWGGIAFSDEITEQQPAQRSEWDGDSGASRAVHGALLSELSNESMRGHRCVIATTNCPQRMGDALLSRFLRVPVLFPAERDFPPILVSTARRVDPRVSLDDRDPAVLEAARIFYAKGANPRMIRSQLSLAVYQRGSLDARALLFAAHDLCEGADWAAMVYADLWALKVCSSRSLLPWAENPAKYPFPPHLKALVDPNTGVVNMVALEKRIEELRPYVNL